MAVISKGQFEVDLKLFKLRGDLSEEDRQCAWELYTELSTRVAVVGKPGEKTTNFDGELYIESLDSFYKFFCEARGIMRGFPVGRISGRHDDHLGVLIHSYIKHVLRPFLEQWHTDYRHWWEHGTYKSLPPFERQTHYPHRERFLKDWANVRWLMRKLQDKLVTSYKLVTLD